MIFFSYATGNEIYCVGNTRRMYGLFLDISVLFLGRVLDGSEVRNPEALTLFNLTVTQKTDYFRGLCLLTGVTYERVFTGNVLPAD